LDGREGNACLILYIHDTMIPIEFVMTRPITHMEGIQMIRKLFSILSLLTIPILVLMNPCSLTRNRKTPKRLLT
jgi:hypothetical protein